MSGNNQNSSNWAQSYWFNGVVLLLTLLVVWILWGPISSLLWTIGDATASMSQRWWFHNICVAILLAAGTYIFISLRKREYWRSAFRQVFERKIVLASFVIINFYLVIALLDSVGYHHRILDEAGEPLKDNEGRYVTNDQGVSLLDLLLIGLKNSTEEDLGYSAPFATHTLEKSTYTPEGATQPIRATQPLLHPRMHVFGTDRIGEDVLYQALKSIRTGMVIGALTTLLVIPFALFFGVIAGYYGGFVDDVVQYIYTVLASIPSILLIIAFVMATGQGLTQVCVIMGITSWTGLCRLLRGETYRLREMEYVQSAEAMGVSHARIMVRHIVPNLMHLVLITAVLGFSNRVLAEAVLAYLNVGVGPNVYSWGAMINSATSEFAREPIVWWNLTAAFIFMMGLVLPFNLFGDALRDALDPRLRTR